MHLLGLGERLAVSAFVDDVVDRETLGAVPEMQLRAVHRPGRGAVCSLLLDRFSEGKGIPRKLDYNF